jgi:hypothetical protein
MMTFRNLLVASVSCVGLFGACQRVEDEVDDYRNAIPRQETVEMQVPAQSGQALTVEAQSHELRGETAGMYLITRKVSAVVNGGGALVLGIVKAVVAHRPTTLTADTAVWGPWKGGPLDPLAYKVTVKRNGADKFDYVFEGRPKNQDSAAFVPFLTGSHTPVRDAAGHVVEGFGTGSFTLDWDARATLPAPGDEVGKAHYDYTRPSATAGTTVKAEFRRVKDAERPGELVDVDYVYGNMPGAGGGMEFVHSVPAAMANAGNRWAVKSRWTAAGAGRSDVKATGAALPGGQATASECWNTSFASTYLSASWAPQGGWGDENADCAFKPADYSTL